MSDMLTTTSHGDLKCPCCGLATMQMVKTELVHREGRLGSEVNTDFVCQTCQGQRTLLMANGSYGAHFIWACTGFPEYMADPVTKELPEPFASEMRGFLAEWYDKYNEAYIGPGSLLGIADRFFPRYRLWQNNARALTRLNNILVGSHEANFGNYIIQWIPPEEKSAGCFGIFFLEEATRQNA